MVPQLNSRTPCRNGGENTLTNLPIPSSPASLYTYMYVHVRSYLPSLVHLVQECVAREKYLRQWREKVGVPNSSAGGGQHSRRWWLTASRSLPIAHRDAISSRRSATTNLTGSLLEEAVFEAGTYLPQLSHQHPSGNDACVLQESVPQCILKLEIMLIRVPARFEGQRGHHGW